MSTFVVNGRNGSVPFLSGAVPQLESDAVSAHNSVFKSEIVPNCGRYILSELVPHELTDERGLADRSAADKADFDKFVNLLGVFLENFQ